MAYGEVLILGLVLAAYPVIHCMAKPRTAVNSAEIACSPCSGHVSSHVDTLLPVPLIG